MRQHALDQYGLAGLRSVAAVCLADHVVIVAAEHAHDVECRVPSLKYGIGLGALLAVLIVLTNVMIPDVSDEAPTVGFTYLAMFGYVVGLGFRERGLRAGARIGLATLVLAFVIAMATFFAVDNLFIEIVSRQPEKALGFATSDYRSMRDYINAGLLRGLAVGVPAAALVGAMLGALGARLRRALRPDSAS